MIDRKKVLFVHDGPLLQNETNGDFYGVHYTNELVDRYLNLGHELTFLMRIKRISHEMGSSYSLLKHPKLSVVEVPNYKSIKTYYQKKTAENIIKNQVENSDVVVLRMPSANATIAYKYAVQYGKPFLVEVVACVFDALWNYDWRGKVLAYPKYWTYRKMIEHSPFVIYVTEKFLQSRYPTSGKSLGCSDVMLLPSDEQILLKHISKIQNEENKKTILITVAAIDVPYKGQADVIEVLSKLNQNDFEYWIVGQGNPERLQKIIAAKNLKNVKIIGSVKHSEIFNLLEGADLYIQPSRQEGLPRAVIEAMSVGMPVIGTNIAGIPELLQSDCIYSPYDLKLLENLIIKFDKNKSMKWARQNFKKAQDYQQTVLDAKRNKFYQEIKLIYK